jgi:hypothetical protein
MKIHLPVCVSPGVAAEFNELVRLQRVQTLDVPVRAVAVVLAKPRTKRKTSTAVDTGKVRIKTGWQIDELAAELYRPLLGAARLVGLQIRRLACLFGGDFRGA